MSTKKNRKTESVKERLLHDENAWAKLGEQLASQTKNIYGQLGDIYREVTRLQGVVAEFDKRISVLEKGRSTDVDKRP